MVLKIFMNPSHDFFNCIGRGINSVHLQTILMSAHVICQKEAKHMAIYRP